MNETKTYIPLKYDFVACGLLSYPQYINIIKHFIKVATGTYFENIKMNNSEPILNSNDDYETEGIALEDDKHLILFSIDRRFQLKVEKYSCIYQIEIFLKHKKEKGTEIEIDKIIEIDFDEFSLCEDKKDLLTYNYKLENPKKIKDLEDRFKLIHIDMKRCYEKCKTDKINEMSQLELWAAIINCETFEDFERILEKADNISEEIKKELSEAVNEINTSDWFKKEYKIGKIKEQEEIEHKLKLKEYIYKKLQEND